MENVQSYIESGILELYVLGSLDADEKAAVESMAKSHPVIQTELDAIEETMSKVADGLSVEPSPTSKAAFLNQLQFSDEQRVQSIGKVVNAPKAATAHSSNRNFYKYAFAASLALLVASIVAIVNLSRNLQDSKEQITQLQTNNQDFANQVNYLHKQVKSSKESLSILASPDFKMVKLQGTDKAPTSNIIIAFNEKEQKVMLDFTSMNMPKNDGDHQYQLWALVDGKPVDLGVFDSEQETSGLKDMKSIGRAQTFAVTLEPKGGSPSPTLENLMVIGNI